MSNDLPPMGPSKGGGFLAGIALIVLMGWGMVKAFASMTWKCLTGRA